MTQPAAASRPSSHEARDLFLRLWAKELPTTRKVLERIPEGSDYRPDPKSRTAREIAWLIVREQIALVDGLERGEIHWIELPTPATMAEVLALDNRRRPADRAAAGAARGGVGHPGPVHLRRPARS